ncbi:MAG: ISNCY family transposase, partial [Alphaproteobacteria bacterium]|nr:ISNCY family transposase [Alphaproteobacteria bacterium]
MSDIGTAAFSVFFMQSPSFLAHQRSLETGRGKSNCQTLFAMAKVPTDNHIRKMLDPVEPDALFPLFANALAVAEKRGALGYFQRPGGHVMVALDGTQYFKSQKLGCPNCQTRKRNNARTEHYHCLLSATIVAPGHARVLPLEPEFITPQDGHDKQDCENAAVKRWLAAHGRQYACLKPVYLGDDLMSRQPICESVQKVGGNFVFTAKPSSHKTLYEWLDGVELPSLERRVKKGRAFVTHRYRWLRDVPLRDGKDALHVNWFEIEVVNKAGEVTYRNSFVTDLKVDKDTVIELTACGRARWKIENEAFNTLKTKGYNLEHNFGHGKQHLSALLATMNLLAFAYHTVCDLVENVWRKARQATATRKRFFEELRSITRYLVFPDWDILLRTMVTGVPPPELLAP